MWLSFIVIVLLFVFKTLALDYGHPLNSLKYSVWDILFPIISFIAIIIFPCIIAVWVIFKTLRPKS